MNPTRIRLGGPSDILAVLPYQLGFHPRDSLVVVSLHGTRMGLVQRIDLPPAEHAAAAVEAMLPALLREAPDGVLLLGYERTEGEACPWSRPWLTPADEAGLAVRDRIVVRDGRWFSLQCDDPSCCPAGGRPLPAAARGAGRGRVRRPRDQPDGGPGGARGPAATGATTAGRTSSPPAPTTGWRPGGPPYEGTAAAFHDLRRRELQTWATVLRCRDEDGPMPELTPSELARLAVSLTDVDIRDALVAWICPGALTLDLVPEMLREQMVERPARPAAPRRRTRGSTRPSTRPAASGWSAGWSRCAPRFPRPGPSPR